MSKPDTAYAGPVDDRDEDPPGYQGPDPHGIVPGPETFPFESVAAAEARADPAGDVREQPRCPACVSTNISVKPGATSADPDHKRSEDYRCAGCGHHFDSPAPSVDAEGVPQHQGCGRALHVRRVGEGVYRCHRCEETWWSLEGFGDD
jgi:DNA-directed RNA polymerase subunit RPC12/RpoP